MKRKICSPVSHQSLSPFMLDNVQLCKPDVKFVQSPPAAQKSMYPRYATNDYCATTAASASVTASPTLRTKNGSPVQPPRSANAQGLITQSQGMPSHTYQGQGRQTHDGLYGAVGQQAAYPYSPSVNFHGPVQYPNPPSSYSSTPSPNIAAAPHGCQGPPIHPGHHSEGAYSVQRVPGQEMHYVQNMQVFPRGVTQHLHHMPRPVYPPSGAPGSEKLKKKLRPVQPSFQDILNESLGILGQDSEKKVETEARALQDLLETKLRREATIMASEKVPDVARTDSPDVKDKKARRLASNRSAASRSRLRKQAYSDAMEKLSLKILTALLRLRAVHGYVPTQFERERDMNVLE